MKHLGGLVLSLALGFASFACAGRATRDEETSTGAAGATSSSGAGAPAGGASGTSGNGGASAGMAGLCVPPTATSDEVAETPRKDQNLELLALRISGTVVADQAKYDRIVRDVAAIRALHPELADIAFSSRSDGTTLLLEVDLDTLAHMQNGAYHDWDCLNQRYVVQNIQYSMSAGNGYATVTLKGLYNLDLVGADYRELRTFQSVGPNSAGVDGSSICLTLEGDVWDYVFDRASGDCIAGCTDHEYHAFSTTLDGTVSDRGRLDADQALTYASNQACH